jgi:uncharacterized membrane protein
MRALGKIIIILLMIWFAAVITMAGYNAYEYRGDKSSKYYKMAIVTIVGSAISIALLIVLLFV